MASLTTLQGRGGGRIPMDGFSYAVSRRQLADLLAALPADASRALYCAADAGDLPTAQRLLREAAVTYLAAPSAAPAAPPLAPAAPTTRPTRSRPRR